MWPFRSKLNQKTDGKEGTFSYKDERPDSNIKTRVFLSYSRQDKAIADSLRQALTESDIEVLRDIEGTLAGEEWWKRIKEMIAEADSTVFLLSNRSATSKVCADEIEYARSINKKVIPATIENVNWSSIPDGLSKIHCVYLQDQNITPATITTLIRALLTDIKWVREHTRLFERARRWQAKNCEFAELLTGTALDEAENWMATKTTSSKSPTNLHYEYIKASRDADRNEQQRRLAESEEQRKILQEERDRAEQALKGANAAASGLVSELAAGTKNWEGIHPAFSNRILVRAQNVLLAAIAAGGVENAELRHSLAIVYSEMSQVQLKLGDAELALTMIDAAIEQFERLHKDNPKNKTYKTDIGIVFRRKAETLLRAHKLNESIDVLNAIITRMNNFSLETPEDPVWLFHMAQAHTRLGVCYREQNSEEKAKNQFRLANNKLEESIAKITTAEMHVSFLPEEAVQTSELKKHLAASYLNLAWCEDDESLNSPKHILLTKAVNTFEEIVEKGRDGLGDTEVKFGLATTLRNAAQLLMDNEKFFDAQKKYERAVKLLEELVNSGIRNEEWISMLDQTLLNLGELGIKSEHIDLARWYFRQYIEMVSARSMSLEKEATGAPITRLGSLSVSCGWRRRCNKQEGSRGLSFNSRGRS